MTIRGITSPIKVSNCCLSNLQLGIGRFSLFCFAVFFKMSLIQAAPCSSVKFTDPSEVKLTASNLMIVTHPSTLWDGRFSSKVGMDAAVAYAKRHGIPVIYLQGESSQETYFFSDCKPTYWIASSGGEFRFPIEATHVYSVGGHWELCQKSTQLDLLKAWSHKSKTDLTFTQVMDGLYSYGAYIRTSDSYYKDFGVFMDIVSYRKPGEDWPKKKLNLLEMMGIIHDSSQEIEYLKRGLPTLEGISQDFEIQMVVNGKTIEVLRKGRGDRPQKFTFEFIDTLWESGYAPGFLKTK